MKNTDTRPFGYWITAVDRLMRAEFATVFHDEGITRRDWRMLNRIDGTHGDRPHHGRHGDALRRLSDLGWIEHTADGWALTDSGALAKGRLGTSVDEIRTRVADVLAPDEYAAMTASLEKIARGFGWEEGKPLPRRHKRRGRRERGRSHDRGFGHGHDGCGRFGHHAHGRVGHPHAPEGHEYREDGGHKRGRHHGHGHGGHGHGHGHGHEHGHGHGHGHGLDSRHDGRDGFDSRHDCGHAHGAGGRDGLDGGGYGHQDHFRHGRGHVRHRNGHAHAHDDLGGGGHGRQHHFGHGRGDHGHDCGHAHGRDGLDSRHSGGHNRREHRGHGHSHGQSPHEYGRVAGCGHERHGGNDRFTAGHPVHSRGQR